MSTRTERNPRLAAGTARRSGGSQRSAAGSTLIGVFVGVALGLAIAAAVAFFIMRSGSPYQASSPTNATRDASREPNGVRSGKAEQSASKPRFDFYKILPGAEEPKVQAKAAEPGSDRSTAKRALAPEEQARSTAQPGTVDAKGSDRFWLQAGSFVNPGEAENLKARLALAGWEANVQEADVPEKGVRFRVRLGPYANTDELNRVRNELGQRGFEVAVIRQ